MRWPNLSRAFRFAGVSILLSTAAIVLAFAVLPVAFGEAGAPEQKLAERLSADTEAGVLSQDEAAIYTFLALCAPDQLPTSYKSLSVDGGCSAGVVRAAKDAATRVEPELSAAFAAALPQTCSGTFAHSIRSSVYPLMVHYEDADLAVAAADTLRFAEEQWDLQVLTMGQTAPVLDGGACEPSADRRWIECCRRKFPSRLAAVRPQTRRSAPAQRVWPRLSPRAPRRPNSQAHRQTGSCRSAAIRRVQTAPRKRRSQTRPGSARPLRCRR